MNYKVTLSFDGSGYKGWQFQKNGITVQEVVTDAANRFFASPATVTGCSRTDSGVHAEMFICTIDIECAPNSPPIEKVADALNHYLPDDISVKEAKVAPETFHPRYDVRSKEYRYVIWNAREKNPFLSHRALHWPAPLDEAAMNEAAAHFIGEHDFAAFCKAEAKEHLKSTVRTVLDFKVHAEGDKVIFTVSGNGFLHNMVRIMVGSLIYISEGKRS